MNRVIAVSLGPATRIDYRGKPVETGIFKTPVAGGARVGALGFTGDVQVDRKNHGGPDKAVYVYSLDNHAYWAERRGEPAYPPGQFGENLTVSGLTDEVVHLGDLFQIGEAEFQVTQPRVPCFKLGAKFGDAGFVAEFHASGRTGFYCRVLRGGWIRPGDPIAECRGHPEGVTIRDAMRALIPGPEQADWMARVLRVDALSSAWREDLGRRLRSKTSPHDKDTQ